MNADVHTCVCICVERHTAFRTIGPLLATSSIFGLIQMDEVCGLAETLNVNRAASTGSPLKLTWPAIELPTGSLSNHGGLKSGTRLEAFDRPSIAILQQGGRCRRYE